MPYQLSASKLQAYHRCPKAYYFQYERGLKTKAFFGSATFGTALHQTLAKVYRDWHYCDPLPELNWLYECWELFSTNLTSNQITEGQEILESYYYKFMTPLTSLRRPLAVEGKIAGRLEVANLAFNIAGRYDRIDWLDEGLELIDYKSTKQPQELDSNEIDLQIGLYYVALEQRYGQSLKRMSLLYLRSGELLTFDASPEHKQILETTIRELALQLRTDSDWEPAPGDQCDRCTFTRYCPAVTNPPEPLPESAKPARSLQLSLEFTSGDFHPDRFLN
ncbi:MAG: RecB family exonuclease [Actinomycetota bacterium]